MMRPSTLYLSLLLAGSIGYAGYLQFENARLKSLALSGSEAALEGAIAEGVDPASVSAQGVREMALSAGDAEGNGVAAAAAVANTPTEDASAPDSRAEWRERRQERMQRMAAAFDDPEMRVDMIERQMMQIDARYADFFRTLDLSPDQLDSLRELMAERNVVNWEMRMRSAAAESDEERERLSAERGFQRDVLMEEIESLLGEEGAVALQDYNESLPYRGEVEALASSLSFTDTPLTERQSEALVQGLRKVNDDFEYTVDLSGRRGLRGAGATPAEVETYFSERERRDAMVLRSVASALSEEQLAAYAERQLAERERDRRQMEFMGATGGPDGWDGRGRR